MEEEEGVEGAACFELPGIDETDREISPNLSLDISDHVIATNISCSGISE